MRYRYTFSVLTLAFLTATGCGGGDEAEPATETDSATTPAPAAQPAAAQPAAAQPTAPRTTPPQRRTAPSTVQAPAQEIPYVAEMTGTIDPGMTRDQVIGMWGDPAIERSSGDRTYLYFRNGCERSCGTYDLVLLEGGQVVDAVVRHPGHGYSGVSSSPSGRTPEFTPPDSMSAGGNLDL